MASGTVESIKKRLTGESLTVSGTTDSYGIIRVNKTKIFRDTVGVFSNVSDSMGYPYNITVSEITDTEVALRVRSLIDNSAIANTSVDFQVLLFGIEA